MTDYITKMMKTAGVTQIRIKNECENCAYNMEECGFHYCEEFIYPNFTAEKQLGIIKLLLSGLCDFTGYHGLSNKYHLCFGNTRAENPDFTQALAQLTTELMNAGELDKERVKEVLEGC